MLTPHRTRQHWHIPTPFSDADGGPISLRLPRPNLYWLVFVVGWINVAGAALVELRMQHHTLVSAATHSVCVAFAGLSAWAVSRIEGHERFARVGMALSALPALYLPAVDGPVMLPTIFIAAAAALTLCGEIGFRVSRECRCGERP